MRIINIRQLGKGLGSVITMISARQMGYIVRDDREEPFETIIKLDNGRYVRGAECQYSFVDEVSTICTSNNYRLERKRT